MNRAVRRPVRSDSNRTSYAKYAKTSVSPRPAYTAEDAILYHLLWAVHLILRPTPHESAHESADACGRNHRAVSAKRSSLVRLHRGTDCAQSTEDERGKCDEPAGPAG
eukprot:865518-Prymnesium_polylepis.1